ncbi:MAG: DUF3137 domain-containing protein [Lachnospiraceae bacterium]|nr:DUF3137 domain-containing protein [Lachnospiraceae bacterium]
MELKLKTTEEQNSGESEENLLNSGQKSVPLQKPTMYDGKRALEEIEKKRKKALGARIWLVFCWLLEIAVFVSVFVAAVKDVEEKVIIISFTVAILSARFLKRKASDWDKRVYRNFVSCYTDEFVSIVIRSLFDGAFYNYETGFSKQDVQQMKIVQLGNRFYSEDFMRAVYHDVHFRRADVLIEDVEQTGGFMADERKITLFQGAIYEFEFNKPFVCNMQVRDKNFPSPDRPSDKGKLERVQLENVLFNRKYKTYTTNAHETFYILTPQIMEQILKLGDKYLSMSMNFVDQKLIIAIHTAKGSFEPSHLTKKMDYEEEKEKIRSEVMEIIEIVERLKLDNKLFA